MTLILAACFSYLHFRLGLIEGKDVCRHTLEEEEETLHKDVPQHGRDQDPTEIPEYLQKINA